MIKFSVIYKGTMAESIVGHSTHALKARGAYNGNTGRLAIGSRMLMIQIPGGVPGTTPPLGPIVPADPPTPQPVDPPVQIPADPPLRNPVDPPQPFVPVDPPTPNPADPPLPQPIDPPLRPLTPDQPPTIDPLPVRTPVTDPPMPSPIDPPTVPPVESPTITSLVRIG